MGLREPDSSAIQRIAETMFEPRLRELGLAADQIAGQNLEELQNSLERVNDALKDPQAFGEARVRLDAEGPIVVQSSSDSHLTVGILPLLLERKRLILSRLQELGGQNAEDLLERLASGGNGTTDTAREAAEALDQLRVARTAGLQTLEVDRDIRRQQDLATLAERRAALAAGLPKTRSESWLRRNRLAVVLFGTAAVLVGVAVAIAWPLKGAADPNKVQLETAKAIITLATGLLLGGVLKLATDDRAENRKQREQIEARVDGLIGDMHASHDRLETTRLLIAAHRSAKTYGERMRDAIEAHVVLLKIARTPGMGVLKPTREDADSLEWMLAYLQALTDEYQDRYKDVADLQRYDEELTKETFSATAKEAVAHRNAAACKRPTASRLAWNWLQEQIEFPVLEDLCGGCELYESRFLTPCAQLTESLRGAKANSSTLRWPPPHGLWPTIPELKSNVRKKADGLRAECKTAAKERVRKTSGAEMAAAAHA